MSLKVPVIGLIWELIDFVCEGQVLLLSVCNDCNVVWEFLTIACLLAIHNDLLAA